VTEVETIVLIPWLMNWHAAGVVAVIVIVIAVGCFRIPD
jgi:hypothetical protein